ncbi:peptidase M24, structural domain-containing protein [Radiomyces spectabilis]|uniref:peptidase M24, structural domain-containing protein n=1 Tax=Radiomyces spectabilis TaxID=64574 RepID=UPI00221F6D26|nr:peptidase M24, structural domain-containing protein [Radiomyces spectabilis]KAI8393930.1 peptidase M24, structural domain-containing protein [Radiomyces spectabilis]
MSPHPLAYCFSPEKLPTKQHCLKVKKLLKLDITEKCIIYHRGAVESLRDGTDLELDFRQSSHFFYLTGVEEPGFHTVMDLCTNTVYLIPPTISDADSIWKGPGETPRELLQKYDVDEIVSESMLPNLLQDLNPQTVYILHKTDTTMLDRARIDSNRWNTTALKLALDESRLKKFPWEIDLIREATRVSSEAHRVLMQHVRPGQSEQHLEALFRWTCAQSNLPKQAYLPIVASGSRAAIIHYSRNNHPIPISEHTLVLVDAGAEKRCYGSDITRTFPATGKFSPEARTIYDIVLSMQTIALSNLKPGVMWTDIQNLVQEVLCRELVRIGILIGDEEEILCRNIPSAFSLHGLGHSLGLDVHDVGGRAYTYCEGEYVSQFLSNRPIEANMVLTVEPGLYFHPTIITAWTEHPDLQKYFNMEKLHRYSVVGGVRIEDTVVITEDGYENLTTAPKTIKDIESLMASGPRSTL